ncbi:MAG: ester cyclase [Chloroflexota bacterium]
MQEHQQDTSERKMSLVRRWIEEGWNKGNTDVADDVFSSNYVQHEIVDPQNARGGIARMKRNVEVYRKAFPDLHIAIEDQFCSGDRVLTRWKATGTQKGELFGVAPNERHVTVHGMVVSRVENGRIAEEWDLQDNLRLMGQIGLIDDGVLRKVEGTEMN